MTHMTALERSLRAIHHQQPDRVPVIPQAHVWAAYYYGSSSDELMYDGDRYAQIQLQAWRDFGWDGIFVATDSVALAHSLGLEVHGSDVGVAPSPDGMLGELDDVEKLEWVDPRTTRLNEWLKATRSLADEAGDEVLIIGRADTGAFSLAAQLRGMADFLYDIGTGKDRERIHRLLSLCNRYILSFAEMQLEAGAHVVTIGDAMASGSVISTAAYEEYALPYERELARAIEKRGGRLGIHICGDMTRSMASWVTSGASILEFDTPTDFDVAWQAAKGKSCLLGNVDTSSVMTLGDPELVKEECRWRIDRVKPWSGFILSSGCALSPGAPAENLHAMVESAREYGQY
jgi:uroporphyrinogen decarboxylase